ncbi:hypothetical protein F4808DRAFT_437673 [Astrocystis sublimbata]|nr:hypothetical protein F4808DRAFT_437673 [Astrocystis sublimbata]
MPPSHNDSHPVRRAITLRRSSSFRSSSQYVLESDSSDVDDHDSDISDSDDSYMADEELLDVGSSPTTEAIAEEAFTDEMKQLVDVSFQALISTISPDSYNYLDGEHKALPVRTKELLRTFGFEKRLEIEQKLEPGDDNTVVVSTPTFRTHHLSCPFYIHQKESHLSCLTRADIRGIRDLKRHLYTAHEQPQYCPICYDTFTSVKEWESHVRLRACQPSIGSRPEGMSVTQMQRLARRADSWVSRDLQWLLIWEIVFPGIKLPPYPLHFDEDEAAVWLLRDYWSAEGDRIVGDFLVHQRQQHTSSQMDGKPSEKVLKALVLNHMIDQLIAA